MKKFLILLSLPIFFTACTTGGTVSVSAKRETAYTGRGNLSETLMTLHIVPEGSCRIRSLDVRLNGSGEDISAVKLICDGKILSSSAVRDGRQDYRLACRKKISSTCELSVCADIKMSAREGAKVGADVLSVNLYGNSVTPEPVRAGAREILLCRKCLYKPGDFGSNFYRIPTIRQLRDGTLLVVNDKRNVTENDLPEHIDVVSRYSTDGGFTWSEPQYIARNKGIMHGFGDPGLMETEDGTVVCTFCGGERFIRSNKDNPQRSYYVTSKDHGRSWSEPKDVTSLMWGPDALNPICRRYHSSFFTSGNGLLLTRGEHKGRIMIANVTAYGVESSLYNHVFYSDDGGNTWQVSDKAFGGGGDESKMVQLNDGRVLLTTRQSGPRPYVISEDGGRTWSKPEYWNDINAYNNCNGDIIRYKGDTLMLSAPTLNRRTDINIFLSFDDGKTWPARKTICAGPSMYSSLTVLKDGTIGVYFEKNDENIELWYENFSMEWLKKKEARAQERKEGVSLWKDGPLWATCNIGAAKPSDTGDYFSWGETAPKKVHGWGKYKLCGGDNHSLTKYCTSATYGKVDGKTELECCDDAAAAIWGDGWRIPTKSDWEELKSRCTWTWNIVDGVRGYTVSGENGTSIFLPTTGYISGGTFKEYDHFGYYWTATANGENPYLAWDFYLQSVNAGCFPGGRDNGRCVRPIKRLTF